MDIGIVVASTNNATSGNGNVGLMRGLGGFLNLFVRYLCRAGRTDSSIRDNVGADMNSTFFLVSYRLWMRNGLDQNVHRVVILLSLNVFKVDYFLFSASYSA